MLRAIMRVCRLPSLLLLVVLALGALALASNAGAGDPAATFAEAQKRYESGEHSDALPLFREALAATQSPNARLYVARCLRETGQLVEAYVEMRATLRDATNRAANEQRYVATRDASAAELALLEPLVAKLIVAPVERYPGLEVRVDGTLIAAGELGQPIVLLPRTVEINAQAPGKKPFSRSMPLQAGATQTLPVALSPVVVEAPKPTPGTPPKVDEGGGGLGTVQVLGIVVASVGAAGLATFGVTGALSNSRFDQVSEECGQVRCTEDRYANLIDEGKTLQLTANITAGAGGALLATGLAMLIFGPSAEPDDGDQQGDEQAVLLGAAVVPQPNGALFSVVGQF